MSGGATEMLRSEVDVDDQRVQVALRLAEACGYEEAHSLQVTYLALRLFDELESMHELGEEERFWLACAGILHDIGWIEGQAGHNKTSLRIILEASLFPLDERERQIVGAVARYHRKALPSVRHEHFAALSPEDQGVVCVLAALLRVADGLDRTHESVVKDLRCEVSPGLIHVRCAVRWPAEAERQAAWDKGNLLAQVFGRRLFVDWELG
jgi:exopolyphosphatase/pppGpp-phosphohydrolase